VKSTNSDPYRRLIERLRAARKEQGLSQIDLGKRVHMTQSAVSKVESGERALNVVEFVRWAGALNLDALVLLDELRSGLNARRRRLLLNPA
jgi:transcriptional regulator with XRE-family HTH domain